IENTVNESAGVVAKLGDRSKEIGQIVEAISGIAGQTNLLALNAAIEAARAGEQGRGFAVVAEEVRKLAEQSQGAAKQITGLIQEIQSDTERAVAAMNNGTREVKLGTQVVDTAGAAFAQIVGLITSVADEINAITETMKQMETGSRRIVASVKSIDEQSCETASEAETVSAATQEQSASMEEIASASQTLSQMAMELQNVIGKFHI
ncbi:MAG: methyl-accepting chemotaxis protein, partial [Selenomonadaceae bacterium]